MYVRRKRTVESGWEIRNNAHVGGIKKDYVIVLLIQILGKTFAFQTISNSKINT